MMYKVITTGNFLLDSAADLKKTFGLGTHFETSTVIEVWSQYSSLNGSAWLEPTKDSVEEAFGLDLEEAGSASLVQIKD